MRTADLDEHVQLENDVLSMLPSVQRLNSTLVMKNFAIDRPYPTDLAQGRRRYRRAACLPAEPEV